jgi:hypothetical protein
MEEPVAGSLMVHTYFYSLILKILHKCTNSKILLDGLKKVTFTYNTKFKKFALKSISWICLRQKFRTKQKKEI